MSMDPRCYLLGALLLLVIPLPWLAAAVTAAAIHELFHIAAVSLCHGEVFGLHIGPGGAIIYTGPLNAKQELLCALAGPAGSLVLLCFCPMFPRLAICGAVQGMFNLLPFYPLDGGRAIRCCGQIFFPSLGPWLEMLLQGAILIFLLLLTICYRSVFVLILWCFLVCKLIQTRKKTLQRRDIQGTIVLPFPMR